MKTRILRGQKSNKSDKDNKNQDTKGTEEQKGT